MSMRLWILGIFLFALAGCGGGGGSGGNGGGSNPGPTPPPPPTNNAPTITGAPAETVRASETYSFVPSAADSDADTLSFSIANQPYWTTFDTATGELAGAPLAANIGEYAEIVISVSDGTTETALPAFTLAVLPQQLGRANFTTEGDTFPTDNGYQSVGHADSRHRYAPTALRGIQPHVDVRGERRPRGHEWGNGAATDAQ